MCIRDRHERAWAPPDVDVAGGKCTKPGPDDDFFGVVHPVPDPACAARDGGAGTTRTESKFGLRYFVDGEHVGGVWGTRETHGAGGAGGGAARGAFGTDGALHISARAEVEGSAGTIDEASFAFDGPEHDVRPRGFGGAGRDGTGPARPRRVSWFMKIEPSDACLLYTSPSPRDGLLSRMPSSA